MAARFFSFAVRPFDGRAKEAWKALKYFFVLVAGVVVCTLASLRSGHTLAEVAKLDPAVMKSLVTRTGGAYLTAFALASYLIWHFVLAIWALAKSLSEFARDPQSTVDINRCKRSVVSLENLFDKPLPKGANL